MSSRLEIELTSARPDGSFTWRKAGAKKPKGEMSAGLAPDGAKVGDILKVDAEIMIDGIEILAVLNKPAKKESKARTLEILGSGKKEELVTTQLAKKGGRDKGRGKGRDRGPRSDRDRKPRRDGGRGGENNGDRKPRSSRPRRDDGPAKPKPKRLRPTKTHRNAVLEEVAPEMRPIAEQVMRGGVPAVRKAVEEQNAQNREQGMPEIKGEELVAIAEKMLPKLRAAEWRDRADSAVKLLEEVDLRDLRSVVVAASDNARDAESKEIAETLKAGLSRRVEEEHAKWMKELADAIADDRVVRALRISSHPPKAGAPLPADMTEKLVERTLENLTADTTPDRWATVLDALSYSPIRGAVVPKELPSKVTDDLTKAVKKTASKLPQIAALFGVEPKAPSRRRPKKAAAKKPQIPAPDAKAAEPEASTPAPTQEAPTPETPAPETSAPATSAPETPAPETSAPETPAPETPAPEAPAEEAPAPENEG